MKKTVLAALLAASVIGACGGSDDATPSPSPSATSEVPASATQSGSGFVAYLEKLVASMADALEPVDTGEVAGPADDAGEPTKID